MTIRPLAISEVAKQARLARDTYAQAFGADMARKPPHKTFTAPADVR